ncbi:MAG: aminotransferase class III-fold pyridoxal phosphate-dependent enzyme [Myxococcota bacterium]|nr:aminotransferase class III-fold pyridoxal phosphate-dependent enzyme [Myxococcota bacterium]
MKTYEYKETTALFRRAAKVIPCGVYGHFAPAPYVPVDHYPFFANRAQGSKFWDVDGNEFIDYMCGYGPIILGYNHPVVDEAFQAQIKEVDTTSIATPQLVELAELMVDMITIADWAFFAKNGADTTNYAVTIARAATGRPKIIAFKGGYHGTSPWMQAPGHHGVTKDDLRNIIRLDWADFAQLERAIDENDGQVAGLIASPYHHPIFSDNAEPEPGYWQKVEQLLRKKGIVFIVDDIRCGFRLNLCGSNELYGFKPDLICFCKAMANGYPISALVGTDALKTDTAKVFHTGSYWFGGAYMAAAIACLKEMQRIDAPKILKEKGEKLFNGMTDIAKGHGLTLSVTGHPSMAYPKIIDDPSLMLHQDICGESTRRGAFFASHHNWYITTEHTDEDIQRTLDIFDDAIKAVKKQNAR